MIVLNQLDIVNDRLKSMLCLMSGLGPTTFELFFCFFDIMYDPPQLSNEQSLHISCPIDANVAFTCFLFISYQPMCSLHVGPQILL